MINKLKSKINIDRLEFLCILALGIFYRLYKLGVYPGGLQRDEATVAMNSLNLFKNGTDFVGNVNPVYFADWGDGHSALYVWLTQIPLLLNSGNMTPFVGRIVQALVAIATLICVYFIGKETCGKRFGLFSMLIVTVSPWHIMMSRWGLDANLAPGFMMISFLFLLMAAKKEKYLVLAAVFYGITLYSYACTWVVIPVVLLLSGIYLLAFKKIKLDKTALISIFALFIIAIPLLLFVMVNSGLISDIRLPFISIVGMGGYRGDEVAENFTTNLIYNLKTSIHFFIHQTGESEPWEVLLPWGIFYDFGRVLAVIGALWLFVKSIISIVKKTFAWEVLFLIQLAGSAIMCVATYPSLHRLNVMYIPLMISEAYAVYQISELILKKREVLSKVFNALIIVIFIIHSVLLWRDYTGPEYKALCEAYWGIGVDECLERALDACEENNLKMITVEKAAQWPKLVLYSETLAPEFTKSAVYESYPIPWSFEHGDILIQTRIDYEKITKESVYIIYFTDYDVFEKDFNLTKVKDWYVAVPKK